MNETQKLRNGQRRSADSFRIFAESSLAIAERYFEIERQYSDEVKESEEGK